MRKLLPRRRFSRFDDYYVALLLVLNSFSSTTSSSSSTLVSCFCFHKLYIHFLLTKKVHVVCAARNYARLSLNESLLFFPANNLRV